MRARPAELFPSPRDGLFDQLAMVVHAIQAGLHGIQQELRQRGVVTVLGKARHQCALLAHPLLTLCDVPDRLGKVVMLGCDRSHVFARAAAGLGPDSSFLRNSTSGMSSFVEEPEKDARPSTNPVRTMRHRAGSSAWLAARFLRTQTSLFRRGRC